MDILTHADTQQPEQCFKLIHFGNVILPVTLIIQTTMPLLWCSLYSGRGELN